MRDGHVDAVSRKFVAGWAADTARPEAALVLSIWVDGVRVGMTKAHRLRTDLVGKDEWGSGHHGFRFKFAEPLGADRDHTIAIRFDDGTLLPVGEMPIPADTSQTRAAPVPARADLVPVLVTAPGRSGTTLLMSLLAASADIVVAELVPYELRLLAYYAVAFEVLTAPADTRRSTKPNDLAGDGAHVGFNPFNSPQYANAWRDKALPASYAAEFVPDTLTDAIRRLMVEYYGRLAGDQGKRTARFFAEKNNNMHKPTRRFVRRAFPAMKEIVLVRDPRDVLCSNLAYFKSAEEKAVLSLTHCARELSTIRKEARPDTLVVRYEDMVRGEPACFAALSGFLGRPIAPPAAEAGDRLFRKHGTSASPSESVGRWRRDLRPELVADCTARWGDFLRIFGYDMV
jgi:hypothetical protein